MRNWFKHLYFKLTDNDYRYIVNNEFVEYQNPDYHWSGYTTKCYKSVSSPKIILFTNTIGRSLFNEKEKTIIVFNNVISGEKSELLLKYNSKNFKTKEELVIHKRKVKLSKI